MVNMYHTKNIFKVHILFYIVALFCILIGFFKEFIIFSSIIIIHELGHIIGALIFKWKIEKVVLLPFGKNLVDIAMFVIKDDEKKDEFVFLDERLLKTPSIALEECVNLTKKMLYIFRF